MSTKSSIFYDKNADVHVYTDLHEPDYVLIEAPINDVEIFTDEYDVVHTIGVKKGSILATKIKELCKE